MNETTLASYNANPEAYIESSPHEITPGLKAWLDSLLIDVPHEAKILEIGSAFGRDAAYVESLGYQVERSDGAVSFIEYLRKLGHRATLLNVIHDEISPNTYDVIFADAVFLHFEDDEFRTALANVYDGLRDKGRLGLTMKDGTGDELSTAKMGEQRYFNYWGEQALTAALTDSEFSDIEIIRDKSWHNIVARKSAQYRR